VQASLITDHPLIVAGLTVGSSGFFPAEMAQIISTITTTLIDPSIADTPTTFRQALEEVHLVVAIFVGACAGLGRLGKFYLGYKRLQVEQQKWDGKKRRKGDE